MPKLCTGFSSPLHLAYTETSHYLQKQHLSSFISYTLQSVTLEIGWWKVSLCHNQNKRATDVPIMRVRKKSWLKTCSRRFSLSKKTTGKKTKKNRIRGSIMHQIRGNYSNETHYCAEITISHVAVGKKTCSWELFVEGKQIKVEGKNNNNNNRVLVVLLADTMGPSCSRACFGRQKNNTKTWNNSHNRKKIRASHVLCERTNALVCVLKCTTEEHSRSTCLSINW